MANDASIISLTAGPIDSSAVVYPQTVVDAIFDSDGSTLAGFKVVNDLTTGGTKVALSAEQGKVLKNALDASTAVEAYVNINKIANHPAAYVGKAAAVADVPNAIRKSGLCVTYLDSSTGKWIDSQFIGSNASSGWTTVSNWQDLGPVSVISQTDSSILKVGDNVLGQMTVFDNNGFLTKITPNNFLKVTTIHSKYAYVNNGALTFGSLAYFKTVELKVNSNTYIKVANAGETSQIYYYLGVLCDDDGNNAIQIEDYGGEFIVPNNCTHLYINYNLNNPSDIILIQSLDGNGKYTSIEPLQNVATIQSSLQFKRHVTLAPLITIGRNNCYIKNDGTLVNSSACYVSKPIYVKDGDLINAYIDAPSSACAPISFNTNVAFMDSLPITPMCAFNSSNKYTLTVSSSGYIFISTLVGTQLSLSIERTVDSNDINEQVSQYYHKNIAFLGDSITEGYASSGDGDSYYALDCFANVVCERLGGYMLNYGISGTTISEQTNQTALKDYAFTKRFTDIDVNSDIIIVAGGTNDYGCQVPIGSDTDTTDISFYGALDVLCRGLITRFTGKKIVFITPIKRSTEDALASGLEPLQSYRDAIYDIANKRYGLAVIDGCSMGFSPNVQAFKDVYMYDGLHPTLLGHIMYGNNVANRLRCI